MKPIKTKDLSEKTIDELNEMLDKERAAMFDTRRKLVFREIKDVNSVKQHRHNIARIKTLITQKEKQGARS